MDCRPHITAATPESVRQDVSGRVPAPAGVDRTASLARAANGTPERLDRPKSRVERTLDRQLGFIADASHELRTPVAALRTELEEARLHPDQTDLNVLLGRLLCNVNRLQAIIVDVLQLARTEAFLAAEPGGTDLARLVQEHISQHCDPHDVRIAVAPHTTVDVSGVQIGQVLTILLDNARRHARSAVEIQVRRDGDMAELTVTDDGEGISEASRERVFQPFARLDTARSRDRGGTGLGLAIARNIALAHHGTLGLHDSPTGGARFVLRLPLAGSSGRTEHDH